LILINATFQLILRLKLLLFDQRLCFTTSLCLDSADGDGLSNIILECSVIRTANLCPIHQLTCIVPINTYQLSPTNRPQTSKNRKYERGYLGNYKRLRIGISDLDSVALYAAVSGRCHAPFNAHKPPKTVAPIVFMLEYKF